MTHRGSILGSLDNGSSVTVDESSCTGGAGLYGRQALDVPDSAVRDLYSRLDHMYTERVAAVKAAELTRKASRQHVRIMDLNAESVGERSVAMLQRLRDAVSSDLGFQTLRLNRLGRARSGGANFVSERQGRSGLVPGDERGPAALNSQDSGECSRRGAATPGPLASDSPRLAHRAPLPDATVSHGADSGRSQLAEVCDAPSAEAADAPVAASYSIFSAIAAYLHHAGAGVASTTPANAGSASPRSEAAKAVPPVAAPSTSVPLLPSTFGVVEQGGVSELSVPLIKSCREQDNVWHHGRKGAAGVVICPPSSLLRNAEERQKLLPGRLAPSAKTKVSRYKRVAEGICAVGGIEPFEQKWGESIVGRVYSQLSKGFSKKGKRANIM